MKRKRVLEMTKKEKTTFEMTLDVLLAVLIPLAIGGIWFLANVKWWL